MRERPILFSGPMVRAILEGRKSQTRRVIKPVQPRDDGRWPAGRDPVPDCYYGVPGDRLWVRETCRAHEITTKEAEADTYGVMERLGLETPPYGLDGVIYAADGAFREIENTREASDQWGDLNAYRGKRGATVPSIHMPSWACRLVLEVTGVRVERLHDISEDDAKAEGPPPCFVGGKRVVTSYTSEFAALWVSINGISSWNANPWVWVVEFKRSQPQPR